MSNNTTLNPGVGGDTIATEEIAGVKYELVKIGFGLAGVFGAVSSSNRLPVDNGLVQSLTDAQLRASAVPVSGTFFQGTQPVSLAVNTPDVTDRAARLLGHVTVDNASLAVTGTFFQGTQPVSIAGTVAVSNAGLTNLDVALSTRLKPADTLAAVTSLTQFNGVAIALNTGVRSAGTLRVTVATDDVVPVTNAGLTNLDVALSTRLKPADTLAAVTTVTTVTTVSTVTAVSSVNAVVPGTAATNLGKAEDAPHTSGDVGVAALGVRNDLEANLTSADLDYGAIALDTSGRVRTREISNLIATTISGANATVTLTIAAAGAGLFHYITSLEIINVNPTAAAIVGSAVTLGYTSTNIPGSPAWTAGNALAAGVEKVVERITYPGGVKTTTANTATTIVAPAIGAGGLCRIIATYYIAP